MSIRYRAYVRKFLVLMLALVLMISMPANASTVKAKVNSSSAKFYKSPTTTSAHVSIDSGAVVSVSALKKGWAKVKYKGVTGYMKTSALTTASESEEKTTEGSWKSRVAMPGWFDGGSTVLSRGHYGTLLDVKTGITIKIYRMGGHNHADVEPATYADTQKLMYLGSS